MSGYFFGGSDDADGVVVEEDAVCVVDGHLEVVDVVLHVLGLPDHFLLGYVEDARRPVLPEEEQEAVGEVAAVELVVGHGVEQLPGG